MKRIANGLRKFGPYVAVELLLPGGTMIALLMWAAQHYRRKAAAEPAVPA
jgi:hypothetical protein